MNQIKAFGLGGLNEFGKNLFVIEVNQKIFIFDCGIQHLSNVNFGINSIIADFTYLSNNKEQIQGIFLTKIDVPQAYGISYFLKKFPYVKVYLTKISYDILQHLSILNNEQKTRNLVIINQENNQFDDVTINFFFTATNTIGSCGYIVEMIDFKIIYLGDFIVESNFNNELFQTDFHKITNNNKKPTLMLISNVGQTDVAGFTVPKNKVEFWAKNALEKTKENLYISCYENDWYKIYNLLKFFNSQTNPPTISFFDSKFQELVTKIFSKHISPELFSNLKKWSEIKRNSIKKNVIFVTGDEKWLFSRISRLINLNNDEQKLTNKDYFLILGEHRFNNELAITNIINELYQTNIKIEFIDLKKIYFSGASAEDLKLFISLLKPKYFFPFGGKYSNLLAAKKVAISTGMIAEKIFIHENGEVVCFEDNRFIQKKENVSAKNIYIDNLSSVNVPGEIITDRLNLSINGVIFISFGIKKINGFLKLDTNIVIKTHGVNSNDSKMERIYNKITNQIFIMFGKRSSSTKKIEFLNEQLQKKIKESVKYETRKCPFVFPMIFYN